jgi:hypothetical protein
MAQRQEIGFGDYFGGIVSTSPRSIPACISWARRA